MQEEAYRKSFGDVMGDIVGWIGAIVFLLVLWPFAIIWHILLALSFPVRIPITLTHIGEDDEDA